MADALIAALADAVGPGHVLTDAGDRAGYEVDWTGRFRGTAVAVVRPADADEVAAVLRACAAHGAAVVPQGGNTGLVGAGVPRPADLPDPTAAAAPRRGQVVLSLTRLDALGPVDRGTVQVEAGAGVTLAALQRHAAAAGLDAGVDFAARDSCTVGGLVATDAGGMRALRHGTVRARVAGLQAVLADGSVIDRRGGLLKDNAGYDLPGLLVGSEGTLGVITAVRWRLVPRMPARLAALIPVASLAAAADLLAALRPALPSLEACDFFTDDGMELVLGQLGIPAPVRDRAPAYVILECAAHADPADELAAALQDAGVEDALVADSTAERERLWRVREAHTDAIAAAGVPHKLDVGVPLDRLGAFAGAVRATVGGITPGAQLILFGHLGDGNVHVNVLGAPDDAVDEAVLRAAAAHGGTISAEHGVGVAKARFLSLVRSPAELAAMAAIKHALDPGNLLNPGAVLATKCSERFVAGEPLEGGA